MQRVPLVMSIMSDTQSIHHVGAKREIAVDRTVLSFDLQRDERRIIPANRSGDVPYADGLLETGTFSGDLNAGKVGLYTRGTGVRRQRVRCG